MLYKLFNDVYAVADFPLVYIPSFKTIVVADIHLGFEEEMSSKGVFLPRMQLNKSIHILREVTKYVDVLTLIVAGDIKHHFDKLGKREAKDLKDFLELTVKTFKNVIIIRGNHDTFLFSICKKFNISLYDAIWLNRILIVHGHKDIDNTKKIDLIIIGHEHPSIAIKDPTTGYSTKFLCFLLAPLRKGGHVLVLPALGLYQSGTAISTNTEGYLSPILRREAVLEDARPFVLIENEGVIELPRLKIIEDLISYF